MRIALIGEYSGVQSGLKKGLVDLGHDVDLYSNGDSFKDIRGNKALNPRSDRLIDKIDFYLFDLAETLKFVSTNYDVIHLVNPHVISSLRGNSFYYRRLIKILDNTKAIKSLAVAGCEANVRPGLAALLRSPCPGCLKDSGVSECPYASSGNVKIMEFAERFADSIIPFGGPTYAKSYQHNKKYREALPFPVDVGIVPHRQNSLNGKIKIVHGINRAGFKGSNVIVDALKMVEHDYPDVFEVIIPSRLPLTEYINLLSTANVVVDQLYGDGLGMNALYSMGASCIVFSCFDRVKIGKLNLTEAPAIQIEESAKRIYQQIVNLKEWSNSKFVEEGQKSRDFVVSQNSPVKIAQKMLDYWASADTTSVARIE
jgi:hypothetical protein